MKPTFLVLATLGLTACAPLLTDDYPFEQDTPGPLFEVTTEADGVRRALVDATSKTSLVYVDLDKDKELKASEAFETNAWDLAFKRTEVQMNGGAANTSGTVKVAVLKGVAFEALTQAPETGWLQDGGKPVFGDVEGGWYYYDLGVHKVTTREDLLYVVRSSEAKFYKLAFGSYYDVAGTAARLTIRYQAVAPPAVIP